MVVEMQLRRCVGWSFCWCGFAKVPEGHGAPEQARPGRLAPSRTSARPRRRLEIQLPVGDLPALELRFQPQAENGDLAHLHGVVLSLEQLPIQVLLP